MIDEVCLSGLSGFVYTPAMQFCYNDHHRIRVLLSAVVSPACIQWAATCWFQFDSNVDTNTYDLADRRAVFSTSQLLGANSACKTATDVLSSVEITVYKVLAYRLAGGITPEQAPHRILHASAVHQLQRTCRTITDPDIEVRVCRRSARELLCHVTTTTRHSGCLQNNYPINANRTFAVEKTLD